MNYFQIIDAITEKSFSPIYLLYGDEPYFINKICQALQKNVVQEGSKNFDEKILYAEKGIDMSNLLCDLKSYPITGQSQLFIIKNAENLNNIEKLESYFVNPQISTVLVLCFKKDWRSVKNLKTKKWFKIINQKFLVFESKKLFQNQVSSWIGNYLKNKGYNSNLKVNLMLSDFLGNDLEKITKEIDKLTIILTEKNITEFDIEKHVGISRDFNVFELQNSLALKDYQKSLRIIHYLVKNNHPVVLIISSLFSFFSKTLVLHSLIDKSKISASSKLKINPYFFSMYNSASRNYTFDQCVQIISFLKTSDLASKGIPIADHANPNFLQELIFRIIHE